MNSTILLNKSWLVYFGIDHMVHSLVITHSTSRHNPYFICDIFMLWRMCGTSYFEQLYNNFNGNSIILLLIWWTNSFTSEFFHTCPVWHLHTRASILLTFFLFNTAILQDFNIFTSSIYLGQTITSIHLHPPSILEDSRGSFVSIFLCVCA